MSTTFIPPADQRNCIAYFSMEIALDPRMPTYSGGLGALAGDAIRSAADLGVPMIGITLLHRKGFFRQRLDEGAWQQEEPESWKVEDYLHELPQRASVSIEGRTVWLRAWHYPVQSSTGTTVPVFLLDADLAENAESDRRLTDHLYGGDDRYRLCQEVLLGIGGVRMLRALGYGALQRFHMNEGHAALLGLELVAEQERIAGTDANTALVAAVRNQCVFTTHTPVAAGHDEFPLSLVAGVLGDRAVEDIRRTTLSEDRLNMTHLALGLSHYVNGVAKKHAEVSRAMFAQYRIDSITNGVHAETWTAQPFRELFDRHIPGWRRDNSSLRRALGIPSDELWSAHMTAKRKLLDRVNRETEAGFDENVLTLGFARRATGYKRGDLLVTDPERLKSIAAKAGRLQIVYAGKAHPRDQTGKEFIRHISRVRPLLGAEVNVVYLQNYDMDLAGLITSGSDVWLNTPQPPLEASGTSGMKAALNGVPSLSILDGWWIEGCIEGKTGWPVGTLEPATGGHEDRRMRDAASLYSQLEGVVMPVFYARDGRFIEIMRHCISLNGSFFNTHRMLHQYVLKAYFE